MTLLKEALKQKALDVRVLEKNLRRGVVDQATHDQAVNKLPDDSENADWSNIEVLEREVENNPSKRR